MSLLVVEPGLRIPLDEFEFSFVRSAGPGGQNVNKVNTKAVLRWPVAASPSLPPAVRGRFLARFGNRLTTAGELIVVSQRYRDQSRNRADCLEKLREMLAAVATPPRRRKKTKPTQPAKSAEWSRNATAASTNNSAASRTTSDLSGDTSLWCAAKPPRYNPQRRSRAVDRRRRLGQTLLAMERAVFRPRRPA